MGAPSFLNGVNPLSGLAILGFLGAAGYFELKTSLRMNETPMGNIHRKDMSAVWKYGVAGDYNWDPLNLYSSCGDDYKGRKGLRDVELGHGRMAMLGITYFAAWEALTGHPIVENNMLFHPLFSLHWHLHTLRGVSFMRLLRLTNIRSEFNTPTRAR